VGDVNKILEGLNEARKNIGLGLNKPVNSEGLYNLNEDVTDSSSYDRFESLSKDDKTISMEEAFPNIRNVTFPKSILLGYSNDSEDSELSKNIDVEEVKKFFDRVSSISKNILKSETFKEIIKQQGISNYWYLFTKTELDSNSEEGLNKSLNGVVEFFNETDK